MTPHSLWTMILKISGLYFLFQCLTVVPQSIGALIMTMKAMDSERVLNIVSILSTLAFYLIILWLFLFKSDWLIKKLKLDRHFKEEKFELNINRNSILQIAIILVGANIIIYALPHFCSQVFSYYQSKSDFGEYNSKWMIIQFVEMIIGYMLITNNRQITTILENNRRKKRT